MRTDVHKLSLDFNNDHLKAADENEAVIFHVSEQNGFHRANSNSSSITGAPTSKLLYVSSKYTCSVGIVVVMVRLWSDV